MYEYKCIDIRLVTVISLEMRLGLGGSKGTVALSVIIALFYSNYVLVYFLCN